MSGVFSRHMGEPLGLSLMKFTLTYDGELSANGDKRKKWAMRQQFHPQLEELWSTHPTLTHAKEHRYWPLGVESTISHRHHSEDAPGLTSAPPPIPHMDLCAPISVAGREFVPLVRKSFSLRCGLKIQFLRKEPPGKVYQGGDIDNRLKTLFDALQVPKDQQVINDPISSGPIFCLLEDDGLITNLDISTHRLLSQPGGSVHDVRLTIEVDVRVTNARIYNQFFLGD